MTNLLVCSGIPEALKEKSFSNFKQRSSGAKEMYQATFDYTKNYQDIKYGHCKGLALIGGVGIGKTHLLAAIANNLLKRKINVVFVNTPEFTNELRRSQFDDAIKMDKQLKLISDAELVIFDDLAKEIVKDEGSGWVQTQYYKIINHRYLGNLPTLFSSNWDMDQLAKKLGEATVSRLFAMTKERLLQVEDDDFRVMGHE